MSKSLEILLISTACAPTITTGEAAYGGIESCLGNFATVLNRLGHQVMVAAPFGSKFDEGVNFFPTVNLPGECWRDDVAFEKLARQNLIPNGFSVIHDFSHSHPVSRISHGFWAKQHPILSMVWHPPYFNGLANRISEPAYNLCGVSESQAKGLSEIYNQEVKWAHLGIDAERYALQKDKSDRYLWLSVPNKEKGGVEAIQIAKRLGLKLDCVGGQISNQPSIYMEQMKSMCDGEQIRWVGAVPETEKIKYFQNAKAFIFTVLQNEPFGLVMPEALSCGTPVFALNNGSPREIVTEECGVVADSLGELEKRLADFEAKSLGFRADLCRQRALDVFTREKMCERYIKLYEQIGRLEFWY